MKSLLISILAVWLFWLNSGHGAVICRHINECQPTMIRTPKISVPKSNYRIMCTKTPGTHQYTPIKNACTCLNTQVTPASVQRVECDLTAATPAPECCNGGGADPAPPNLGEQGSAFFPANACGSDAVGAGSLPSTTLQRELQQDVGVDEPAVATDPCTCAGPPPAAVDPVSLMLAQAEVKRCRSTVREDRLSFGPIAVPKDARPTPPGVPDVNEEGLYALEKPVIRLKTCKRFGQGRNDDGLASDTDALLALEEDAQAAADEAAAGPAVNLPSFADVGYQTEAPSCAPLMAVDEPLPPAAGPKPKIIYEATVQATDSAECQGGKTCSCGKCSGGKCSCNCCNFR